MNLTKFNRHENIAHISAYAAPYPYSSSVYIAYVHINNNRVTDVDVEHLFSHMMVSILGIHI